MIHGQCLCGAVTFEIDAPDGTLGETRFCYCTECRRANGTAFSANVPVPQDQFRLTPALMGSPSMNPRRATIARSVPLVDHRSMAKRPMRRIKFECVLAASIKPQMPPYRPMSGLVNSRNGTESKAT